MRESAVDRYLVKRVREYGGEVRKVRWIGRRNCPDRRVMLPWICAWVETKRPGEDARDGQRREHERMMKYGEKVYLLDSKEAIDRWLIKTRRVLWR